MSMNSTHIHFSKDIVSNEDKVMLDIVLEFNNDVLEVMEVVWTLIRRGEEISEIVASGMHCSIVAPFSDICFDNALDIAKQLLEMFDFEELHK